MKFVKTEVLPVGIKGTPDPTGSFHVRVPAYFNTINDKVVDEYSISKIGWQDFADSNGTIPTISGVAGGEVLLTNDALGSAAGGVDYTIPGVSTLWNSLSSSVDLNGSGVQAGDFLTIRADFSFTPNVIPVQSSLFFKFYSDAGGARGPGVFIFDLENQLPELNRGAGSPQRFITDVSFFVGPGVENGSFEMIYSASTGGTVDVAGWFIKLFRTEA